MVPKSTIYFLFALVFSLLSACTPAPASPDINPTQGIEMLSGRYTTTITAADVSAFTKSSDPALAENVGAWQFEMFEDGTFTAEREGVWIGNGKYTVTGNQIEIYVEQACEECSCRQSIDRFVWALQGDQLLLRHIAGTCTELELIVTAHGLTRTP